LGLYRLEWGIQTSRKSESDTVIFPFPSLLDHFTVVANFKRQSRSNSE
jgi:hypothetical protein